jgi:uncharacterized protein
VNQMHDIKQHTALQSVLLHLMPGVVILASIFIFSSPLFPRLFGLDEKLGPIVGYLLGILVGLIPVQLLILLLASKTETGKFNLGAVINYTNKNPLKMYFLLVPAFIIYFLLLFVFVAPLIQPYIIEKFFQWWPEQYNFQLLLQDPAQLKGYRGIGILLLFYILLSCISGPLVEELYFRGYLLPRMQKYSGKWAPLLNTVLFSLYHFFSPWENLVRIAASYPLIHTVWKKRDIRISILVHCLVNTFGGVIAFFMIT